MAGLSWEEFFSENHEGNAYYAEMGGLACSGVIKKVEKMEPYVLIECIWNTWPPLHPNVHWRDIVIPPNPWIIIGLFNTFAKTTQGEFRWSHQPCGKA